MKANWNSGLRERSLRMLVGSMDDGRHEAIARLIWIATRPCVPASALYDLVDELFELLPEADRRSVPFSRLQAGPVLRLARGGPHASGD